MTNFAKRLAVHFAEFVKRLRANLWGNKEYCICGDSMSALVSASTVSC